MASALCIAVGMLLGCAGMAIVVTRPHLGGWQRVGLGVIEAFRPTGPIYTEADSDRIHSDSSLPCDRADFDSWYRS